MFKNLLSNQKGAGIVLVLIVCSLVGAAALYLMDITKVSEQKIALDAKVLSYQQVVKYVANHIHAGDNCTKALKDIDISGAFNPNGMSISLDLKLPINPKVLKKPETVVPPQVPRDVWFVQGGTNIKDVLLFVNERVRTPVKLATPGGAEIWSAAKGYILIIPGHPGVGARLARGKQYRIPIFLYYTAAGKILRSCFDPSGDAYFCTVMGGAYDATQTTNVDMRCQPDRTCFPYKSGLVNSPGACPSTPPYVASKIGFFGSDLYLCDWCNPNGIAPEEKGGNYYKAHDPTPYELEMGVQPEPFTGPVTP